MPPAPGIQSGPDVWLAQAVEFLPAVAAVAGAKQRGVLDPGIHRVGIARRGFQVPHPLELPGFLRAVVPLVCAGLAAIREFVADGIPGLAAVVGALYHLPEPVAHLGRVQAIGIGR